MISQIPIETEGFFKIHNFVNYPLVEIPQTFSDSRGNILNLVDGKLGDVAIINSVKGSIRANHYHNEDWHFCFLISGSMEYWWTDLSGKEHPKKLMVNPGEMVYTPPKIAHKIVFNSDSSFISISKLSRISSNYEKDTVRLKSDFFHLSI